MFKAEEVPRSVKEAAMSRLLGLLTGAGDPEQLPEDYTLYLEAKYR